MKKQSDDKKILQERARILAQEENITHQKNTIKIIEFILNDEHYGLETTYIKLVCKAENITPLPNIPPFIEGIVNIHGKLTCVIDLKEIFGLEKSSHHSANRIVIINQEDVDLGILIDSVINFAWIELDSLQTALPTLTGIREDFLLGITPNQTIVLDAKKLIHHKYFFVKEFV